ncbi:MAG TPA: VOC family protein [Pyrinomonadaceae bacterium]|nr:VOC family protein [Pyrinomonadaceae bacterium]
MTAKRTAKSKRPSVAIGHVILHARDVTASAEFYSAIGLRLIVKQPKLAILELRGGTHLLLFEAKRKPKAGPMRSFDFMVDEITSTRASFEAAGMELTPIRDDGISGHQMFEVTDPDGNAVTILSSHTEGRQV